MRIFLLWRCFSGSTEVEKFVVSHLRRLSKNKLKEPRNIALIVLSFKNSLPVQRIILDYLNRLSLSEIKNYLDLLSLFNNVGAAKPIADKYIERLTDEELFTSDNLIFCCKLRKDN